MGWKEWQAVQERMKKKQDGDEELNKPVGQGLLERIRSAAQTMGEMPDKELMADSEANLTPELPNQLLAGQGLKNTLSAANQVATPEPIQSRSPLSGKIMQEGYDFPMVGGVIRGGRKLLSPEQRIAQEALEVSRQKTKTIPAFATEKQAAKAGQSTSGPNFLQNVQEMKGNRPLGPMSEGIAEDLLESLGENGNVKDPRWYRQIENWLVNAKNRKYK